MQLFALVATVVFAVVQPQDTTRRVHDFAELLSPAQRESLESVIRDVERKTTAQIAVVTVKSLDGQTVDSYALELFNNWGIGQPRTNNGVLFLIAPNERRMRIEVGYGLESLLTDTLCGEIRDKQVVPYFKQQDYADGISAGTKQLAAVLLSHPSAARGDPNSGPSRSIDNTSSAIGGHCHPSAVGIRVKYRYNCRLPSNLLRRRITLRKSWHVGFRKCNCRFL